MNTVQSDIDFMEAVMSSRSIEDVWALHVGKMREFGFDRLLYGANRFRTHGEFGDLADAVVLTNHDKDYIDLFFGKGLYMHAPMAVWAATHTGECSWQWALDRRARGETSEQENKLMDLNEKMGVTAGFSISFEQVFDRSKSAMGLCAERGLPQSRINEIWAERGKEIRLYNNLVNQRISTLPLKRQGKSLTDRQREVLQWVADGKTVQDVATILNLSQAAVEKHLRNARFALNADTTAQAVLKASLQNQFFIFEGMGRV